MQGKLVIAVIMAAFGADAAICGESARRQPCQKVEQPQQRQQQQGQTRAQRKQQPQSCISTRTIPPVIDPTPVSFL